MAARGSGIGAGFGGLAGGSQTSTRSAAPGQLYGAAIPGGKKGLAVHHWLWVLVAIEIGILLLCRLVVFKKYHGG